MLNFNLGALSDWHPVAEGEVLSFDLPSTGIRQVDFEVMSDDVVSVIAGNASKEAWLVGVGVGHQRIKFSMAEKIAITFGAPSGVSVFIKTKIATQTLSESGEPTFTNAEPQWMQQSEKISRVQQLMALNAERRVAALLEGLSERERALDERIALIEAGDPPEGVQDDPAP